MLNCSSFKFRIDFKLFRSCSFIFSSYLHRCETSIKKKESRFVVCISKIELLTLNPSGVRPVSPVFAIPGLWMPLPVFIPDHPGPTAAGYSLQTLKSLKSLKIRAQGSSFQRRYRYVRRSFPDVHNLRSKRTKFTRLTKLDSTNRFGTQVSNQTAILNHSIFSVGIFRRS